MGLGMNLVSSDPLTSSHSNTDRLQLITLALVTGPYLYQRVSLIRSVQNNAPGKLQSRSALSSYEVKFADRTPASKAPEDFKLASGNPLGKFPTIKDGDLVVHESGAISE